jgi:hypothetical protein
MRRLLIAALVAAFALAASPPGAAPPEAASAPLAVARDDAITVTPDHRLARACRPWTPRGLDFFGLMVPRGRPAGDDVARAKASFGPRSIEAVRFFGGDTMRLEVGMPFLDPQSPVWTPAFVDEVRAAVQLGRDAGLAVIIVLQWEARTGVAGVENGPGASTLRAWQVLGPVFAGDPGVVYELFNEPVGPARPSAAEWDRWRAGHQAVVDALRRAGARNLLVVDGLHGARSFDGAPDVTDPLGRLAYGVHPYLDRWMRTPEDFDVRFGRFAATHPVIATEWTNMFKWCDEAGGDESAALVAYLERHRIGLVAYGSDENPGRLLRGSGPGDWHATDFEGRACRHPEAGPGRLVRDLFRRSAAADAAAPSLSRAVCEAR